MYFYSKTRFEFSLLFSLLLALTACGGDGGSGGTDTNGGGLNRISYTELPLSSEADEGTQVQLSLNTSGAGSNDLSYEWEVTFQGQDLPFQGQNTDTITFIAPQVDNPASISVSYELELKNGTLLGPNRGFTSVSIVDLNPPKFYETGKTTTLTEVSALDLSMELTGSTWRVNEFKTWDTVIEGEDVTYTTSTQTAVYLGENDSYTYCGVLDTSEQFSDVAPDATCDTDPTVKYYQGDDEFRVEATCGSDIVLARNFYKLNDGRSESFGELSLQFDNYTNLEFAALSCGEIITANVTAVSDGSVYEFGVITLYSEYESLPLVLQLGLDDFPRMPFHSISSLSQSNTLKILSTEIPTIYNILADSGMLTWNERDTTALEADISAEITDNNGATESVDGAFSLSFE